MADNDLAMVAIVDQWQACLYELAGYAAAHLKHCPQPEIFCPGEVVGEHLSRLDRNELRTLAELAIVELAKAAKGDRRALL